MREVDRTRFLCPGWSVFGAPRRVTSRRVRRGTAVFRTAQLPASGSTRRDSPEESSTTGMPQSC